MTVRADADGTVRLEGRCGSEDAEPLLAHLLAEPAAEIDWSACEGLHAAVLQVLLAARRPMRGPPPEAFLAQYVEPLLARG